jgi:DNA-binding GntR family transcriptional regulator
MALDARAVEARAVADVGGAPRRRPPAGGGELANRAYSGIRQAIVSLGLQPGQQLQEEPLAEWLGTSRTPVREALRRLQSEGLVAGAPGRGLVVAQLSLEDVENAYRVIEALEGLSSRMAAERLDDRGAATLRDLLAALREAAVAGDLERWARQDTAFHDHVRAAAANPKLAQLAGLVFPTVERVRNLYLREGAEPDRLARITREHGDLGAAILSGDADRAEALARRLLAEAGRDNVRLLRHWVAPLRRSF